ncbi:MAG: TonB-dependent receptor [Pseudomonadota bacterium]
MRVKHAPLYLAVASAISTLTLTAPVSAQDTALEEVVVTGSRSLKARSVSDSPVPVDVLSAEDLAGEGNAADITESLRMLVPSFTATPYTGDGSAFIRPTSLRGTSPDQALVLVNGKRRHRSALVTTFAPAAGNGAHAVDIGMIPSLGLRSVEVLRDGASSQYGSDAIAGVINFIMKEDDEGGTMQVQYGEQFEGEQTVKVAGNIGLSLGGNGFLNLTGEWIDNEAFDRSILRPDARALINEGVQGVGADTPFSDRPLTQTWGRPELSGFRTFFNAGYDLNDTTELYAFGNYAETEGRYRFFYRPPAVDSLGSSPHPSIQNLIDNFGYDGRLTEVGYTGYLDGDQQDYSLFAGVRGTFSGGMFYDFSVSYGYNEIDYFLNNGLNPDLGLGPDGEPAQQDFDVGAYEQDELNFNADFSLPIGDNLNLAFGAEWREETWTSVLGEPASFFGAGTSTSGFSSPSPEDAGEFDRDNWAVYADLEHDITDNWLMQYAVRYEDFSDFGDTTNGKLATRYRFNDAFAIRGSVSTGFHAPTPGQSNLVAIITTFDGATGEQVEQGQVRSTSEIARSVGGTELTEETSINYSFGFTSDFGAATTLTVDFYLIEVDDRIYRTGDIETDSGQVISFFTNAMDVEHKGIDLVLTSYWDWGNSANTTFSLAYNHNEIEVTDQALVNGSQPVSDSLVEDIENNYPEDTFVFSANTAFAQNWWFQLRANYFGEHFDERGTIDGDFGSRSQEVDPVVLVDLELGWDVTDNWSIALGGTNVFDEYPDKVTDPRFANRLSVGLEYPRRTAAGYDGGAWYLRTNYNF